MVKIKIDISKSIEENAGIYYDKVKKLKKKLTGVNIALERSRGNMKKLLAAREKQLSVETAPVRKDTKKEWYEKYRWFISSEGFLCIGGRDATTNEILIKKHTDKDDIVFHTDMAGSPFFVIKTEGKKPKESTIKETADATVTFSKAWKLGLMYTQVFHVKPDQVTKEAQAGEFLKKGSFMIRGKPIYIDNNVNIAIGSYEDRPMAGPVSAIKKNCPIYIVLEQGDEKVSGIAKKIHKKLGFEIDDIIRVLPTGSFKIIEDSSTSKKKKT